MCKAMRLAAVAVSLSFLCAGCTQMQDAIVRSLHMDYGYRWEMLPVLMDSYERKMESINPPIDPAVIPHASMDQG